MAAGWPPHGPVGVLGDLGHPPPSCWSLAAISASGYHSALSASSLTLPPLLEPLQQLPRASAVSLTCLTRKLPGVLIKSSSQVPPHSPHPPTQCLQRAGLLCFQGTFPGRGLPSAPWACCSPTVRLPSGQKALLCLVMARGAFQSGRPTEAPAEGHTAAAALRPSCPGREDSEEGPLASPSESCPGLRRKSRQ